MIAFVCTGNLSFLNQGKNFTSSRRLLAENCEDKDCESLILAPVTKNIRPALLKRLVLYSDKEMYLQLDIFMLLWTASVYFKESRSFGRSIRASGPVLSNS